MIQIAKLINGEDIIGDITVVQNWLKIKNPMNIIGTRDDEGGMKLRNTLLLSSENEIRFDSTHVMAMIKPSAEMVKYYNASIKYQQVFMCKEVGRQVESSAEELLIVCNALENGITNTPMPTVDKSKLQ